MGFKVEGIDRLTRKLEAMPRRVEAQTRDELEDIGEDLKEESQSRVSVQSGELKDSAYSRMQRSENGPAVEVGYEGLPYIIPHHEGFWRNFRGEYGPLEMDYPGGGQPKWHERSFLEGLPSYKRRIQGAVRRGLRG